MSHRNNISVLKLIALFCFVFGFFVFWLVGTSLPAHAGGGTSDLQQYHYNFRLDSDGLNSEASGWLAADDNPSSDLVKGTTYRVRFNLSQELTKKKVAIQTLEYGSNADCTSGVYSHTLTRYVSQGAWPCYNHHHRLQPMPSWCHQ